MQILVPLYKDEAFPSEFKKYLLYQISSLYSQYGKVPELAMFKGKLGKILYDIVLNNKWNLGETKISHDNGPDLIEISFTKNITVSNNANLNKHIISIDGKVVDGWSGDAYSNAMSQISPDMNFNIERTETPKITILLKGLSNK